VYEIVDRAVQHEWSIPEFQRGFVWKQKQVRDLAESLWSGYPVGSLLVWNSKGDAEPRIALDAQAPANWLVDGQQRTTALCLLFGRKPYWWSDSDDWNKKLRKFDIRFDVTATDDTCFRTANAVIRKDKTDRYVKVSTLLNLDTAKPEHQAELSALAKRISEQGLCDGMDAMDIYQRLDRVRKVRDKDLVAVTVDHDLEDVVEIFSRLNSRGTRVTEADIYLGIVAARNQGWVRDSFLPYLRDLAEFGFGVSPNLLFRCLTGIGAKKTRFKEVDDDFWSPASIEPAWRRTTSAWGNMISFFKEYGICSNGILPTEAALVTITALLDRFADTPPEPALYWFVQASILGRYTGSGTTSLNEDLQDVEDGESLKDAVRRLLRRIPHESAIEPEFFLKWYTDGRAGRFLLYLMVFANGAKDWDIRSHRIGFDGQEVLSNFWPQFHHIFPKKYLSTKQTPDDIEVDEDEINALANIAVIGPSVNIRIGKKDPMSYIQKYEITADKLQQQYIKPDVVAVAKPDFTDWLNGRAEVLTAKANELLKALKGDL